MKFIYKLLYERLCMFLPSWSITIGICLAVLSAVSSTMTLIIKNTAYDYTPLFFVIMLSVWSISFVYIMTISIIAIIKAYLTEDNRIFVAAINVNSTAGYFKASRKYAKHMKYDYIDKLGSKDNTELDEILKTGIYKRHIINKGKDKWV
jgi:hypothetical protein